MPWKSEWVDPELFHTHKGVKIYRTYKNDDVDSGPSSYHFTTDPASTEGCDEIFDVRDLPTWTEPPLPPLLSDENDTPENRAAWLAYPHSSVAEAQVRTALHDAIDRGVIGADGRIHPACPRCGAVIGTDRPMMCVRRRSGRRRDGSELFCSTTCADAMHASPRRCSQP